MIEVKEYEGRWAVYLDDEVLATSKARFDADAAKLKLDRYVEKALIAQGAEIGRILAGDDTPEPSAS